MAIASWGMTDTVPESVETRSLASALSRFVADASDGIILGSIGFAAGLVLRSQFTRLGLWAPVVGFCITLAYFTYCDSSAGNGQSPGKRWLRIRVVDAGGNPLPLDKALNRSIVYAVPVALMNIKLPVTRLPTAVSVLVALLVYGVGGVTVYLILFDNRSRQGLHDRVAGSYVVNEGGSGPVAAKPVWPTHWLIFASLFVAIAALSFVVRKWEDSTPPFPQMHEDARRLEHMHGVERATVRDRLQHKSGRAETVLTASVTLSDKSGYPAAMADQAAHLILQNDPTASAYHQITIRTYRGYDIGVASHWDHQEFTHTPAEWSERVTTPTVKPGDATHP